MNQQAVLLLTHSWQDSNHGVERAGQIRTQHLIDAGIGQFLPGSFSEYSAPHCSPGHRFFRVV